MRRIIYITALFLCALLVLLAQIISRETERHFTQAHTHSPLSTKAQASSLDYRRGWLASEAHSWVTLSNEMPLPSAFELNHHIQHTLFLRPTRVKTTVRAEGVSDALADLNTEVALNGGGQSKITLYSGVFQGGLLTWKKGQGELFFNAALSELRGDLKFSGATLRLRESWSLAGGEMRFTQHRHGPDGGETEISLSSSRFLQENTPLALFECRGMVLRSNVRNVGNLHDINVDFSCVETILAGKSQGRLDLGMTLCNLDMDLMAQMSTSLQAMLVQQNKPAARNLMFTWLLLQYARDFFKSPPAFEITRFNLGKKNRGTLLVYADAVDSRHFLNPLAAARRLRANMELSVSRASLEALSALRAYYSSGMLDEALLEKDAVRTVDQLLDFLLEKHYAAPDEAEGVYNTDLSMAQGNVHINGQSFNF